jgi:hypothetical protein
MNRKTTTLQAHEAGSHDRKALLLLTSFAAKVLKPLRERPVYTSANAVALQPPDPVIEQ